jgi:hypothetical protein
MTALSVHSIHPASHGALALTSARGSKPFVSRIIVVPVDALHMWNAAVESKPCRLTALREHYRQLAEDGYI